MAGESQAIKANSNGIELPLLLFALFVLLAVTLPSRERALLPFGDATGFLAQSAADERLPGPFGYAVDDPVARTGFAVLDRSGRLLNPVLRAGGAGSRSRTRNIAGPGRGSDAALPEAASESLGIIDNTALAVADGSGNPGSRPGNPGSGSGGPPDGVDGQPVPPFGGGPVLSVPGFGAVPEPTTWILLIMGFGFIGQLLRRRRASHFSAVSVRLPES